MKPLLKISLIVILMILASCKKEDTRPCNCGLIVSDNAADYSIVIRNECTGNEKKFILAAGDWFNAYVGSDYCITNSGKW